VTEEEILTLLQEESDRLWMQYLQLKGEPEFNEVATQVLTKHHQTCRIALRIVEGRWPG
jgi:hypothetical protein